MRADCGKICIAVSDDIDPTNTNAVLWSIAYRSNPAEDVHIVPHRSGGHGPKSGRRQDDASLLVDATLKQTFPPLALPARAFMERARGIWEELGLAALKPQPPWHGYSLGDWDTAWDEYARRAVSRRMGAERRGDVRAPARRAHAGDAGARRGEEVNYGPPFTKRVSASVSRLSPA